MKRDAEQSEKVNTTRERQELPPGQGKGDSQVKHGQQLDVRALLASGVQVLKKRQMAAALQISIRSLTGMMQREEIAYFRIGRRVIRFRIEEALKRMDETVLVRAKDECVRPGDQKEGA